MSQEGNAEPKVNAEGRELGLSRLRQIAATFRNKMSPIESTQVNGMNQWGYGRYRRDFYQAVVFKAKLVRG